MLWCDITGPPCRHTSVFLYFCSCTSVFLTPPELNRHTLQPGQFPGLTLLTGPFNSSSFFPPPSANRPFFSRANACKSWLLHLVSFRLLKAHLRAREKLYISVSFLIAATRQCILCMSTLNAYHNCLHLVHVQAEMLIKVTII